ncbi:MAG: hypothetical protein KAH77_02225 [Thiomargarita sp.]|nr:hypothetical protein [Thiomargarita sp.]
MKTYMIPIFIALYCLVMGMNLTACGQKGELVRPIAPSAAEDTQKETEKKTEKDKETD